MREVVDEGAIDLHRRQREAFQVRQRRVPGAEVVDGEPDAHVADLLQQHHRMLGVLHHRPFGDLELEQLRRESTAPQRAGDVGHERAAAQLARRQVHAHAHRRQPALGPAARIGAGALERPAAHGLDEAGLLRDRNELRRRHVAQHRVAPTNGAVHGRCGGHQRSPSTTAGPGSAGTGGPGRGSRRRAGGTAYPAVTSRSCPTRAAG